MKSIDHIGIAVNSVDEAINIYKNLGFEFLGEEIVKEQGVRLAKFNCAGVHLEFLEPISAKSPIKKFLETKGQGIHHIAYKCDDVKQKLSDLKIKNIKALNEAPIIGSDNSLIAFLHPKSTIILTELVQKEE